MRLPLFGLAVCVLLANAAPARSQVDCESLNLRVSELHATGRYAEAIPLAKRFLELTERQFGKDATDTAMILRQLAGLYKSQGQYA